MKVEIHPKALFRLNTMNELASILNNRLKHQMYGISDGASVLCKKYTRTTYREPNPDYGGYDGDLKEENDVWVCECRDTCPYEFNSDVDYDPVTLYEIPIPCDGAQIKAVRFELNKD